MAAGLDVREGLHARLVVEACGPMAMVEAAQKAVEAAQSGAKDIRLQFFGLDSRW